MYKMCTNIPPKLPILSCEFEVFGLVQGVSFRMYTQKQATAIGVRGWCMNTYQETVKGEIQGTESTLPSMKTWLQKTGSPQSRIDRAEFGEIKELPDFTYPNFSIRQ